MISQQKTVLAVSAFVVVMVTAACVVGCGQQQSRLLERHLADSQEGEAQKRWHDVRSGMKVQMAEQHLSAGRIAEAEEALEHAIALSPENVHGYLLATRLRLMQGRLAEAREMIRLAAALPNGHPDIDYYSGVIAQRYGELENALEHYTAAAMKTPNDEKALVAQAETLVSLGRTVDAMELILAREADFEDSAAVHLLAARVCQRVGLRGPAVEQCHKVMRVSSDDVNLQIEMGLLLAWAEQYDESIAVLKPLVNVAAKADSPFSPRRLDTLSPVTPIVVHVLANAYLATGQNREAQDVLGFVMGTKNVDTMTQSLFARAALLAGDLTQAADALETVHRRGAGTAETWLLAAYLAYEQGDEEASRLAVLKSLKRDENLEPAQWLLARVSGQTSLPVLSEQPSGTSLASKHEKADFGRAPAPLIDTREEAGAVYCPSFEFLLPSHESQSFLAEAQAGGS